MPVQPTLDGTLPPPAELSYAEWIEHIRPTFVAVAKTGRRFTTYEVAREYRLPEPSNPKADWGNAVQQFAREGLIEDTNDAARSSRPTSERSRVGVWRGTHAAQAGRVA
ncbi:hypothetical protein AB0J81_09340 [Streptomyces bobili]|uniref:hypothetical protein n=1 Tax=Streptomyces bobili TaxID=67280 RepID=UPI00342E30AA